MSDFKAQNDKRTAIYKGPKWSFTLNNYTETECESIRLWAPHIAMGEVGIEVGEEGTKHLQGNVIFKKGDNKRLAGVKKLLPRANWSATGNDNASALYCVKEGNMVLSVDNRQQGKDRDTDKIFTDIANGMTLHECWMKYPRYMVTHFKGIERYHMECNREKEQSNFTLADFPGWKPITNWETSWIVWGDSGIGKTEWVLAHFENPLFVSHIDQLIGFNKNEHDGIIFDDMDFDYLPRSTQINLLDINQSRAIHIRNFIAQIPRNTKKVFTTNTENGEIFRFIEECGDEDKALMRRVKFFNPTLKTREFPSLGTGKQVSKGNTETCSPICDAEKKYKHVVDFN